MSASQEQAELAPLAVMRGRQGSRLNWRGCRCLPIRRPVENCMSLGVHPCSNRSSLNVVGSKGWSKTFKCREKILLKVRIGVSRDYPRHKVLNQKLKGCDSQPFIVNMQNVPPAVALHLLIYQLTATISSCNSYRRIPQLRRLAQKCNPGAVRSRAHGQTSPRLPGSSVG